MREKLKDVEAFFEGRSRIASFDCLQSVCPKEIAEIVNRILSKTVERFADASQKGI